MKTRMLVLALVAALASILAGCGGGGHSYSGDESRIRGKYHQMERAIENQDIGSYMDLYSYNYLDNGYNFDDVKNAIANLFVDFTDIVESQDIHRVNIQGNYAYVSWTETLTATERATGLRKQSVTDYDDVWHYENGDWYLYGNQATSLGAAPRAPFRHSAPRLKTAPVAPAAAAK